MTHERKCKDSFSLELLQLVIWFPAFVFLLLCYWEVVVSPPDDWDMIFGIMFYCGIAGAGLVSLLCGTFIVIGSRYQKAALLAWSLIVSALVLGVVIARGIASGIPKMAGNELNYAGELFLWLSPILLMLWTYFCIKRSFFESDILE